MLDLSQLIELETPEGFSLAAPVVKLDLEPLTPPDEVYQTALSTKAAIQAAQYRLEGSKHNIRIAQSAFYPQLSFSGSLGTNYYSTIDRNFGDQMRDNFSKYVGFSLSVPLFNRFTTRNRVRTARLQQENYSLQLDNTKKTLYKEIQQAYYNATAAQEKYLASDKSVQASEEAFKYAEDRYNAGKSTVFEFNEAKTKYAKSLAEQAQSKYEFIFRTKILDFYNGTPLKL